MGVVRSKSRSLGQILEKPCLHSGVHFFSAVVLKLTQNIYLDDFLTPIEYRCGQVNKQGFRCMSLIPSGVILYMLHSLGFKYFCMYMHVYSGIPQVSALGPSLASFFKGSQKTSKTFVSAQILGQRFCKRSSSNVRDPETLTLDLYYLRKNPYSSAFLDLCDLLWHMITNCDSDKYSRRIFLISTQHLGRKINKYMYMSNVQRRRLILQSLEQKKVVDLLFLSCQSRDGCALSLSEV